MNKIILDSKATISKDGLTKGQIASIKQCFTIANPLFHKLTKMGKPTWATPKRLRYYEETPDNIIVPLGGGKILANAVNLNNYDIEDNRFESPNILNIKFTKILRNYQKKASDALMQKTIGTLQATTGSGKTIIAIYTICERKQPTLFLVHTRELAHQFIARLKSFTNIKSKDIGIIGDGKYQVKDVSVGLLQTITKLPDERIKELNSHYGQVFVDETHIVPASTFFAALSKLKQKYRFGLTATPFRADGLTDVIFFTTGSIIHKIDPKEVEDHIIIPKVEYVMTDYKFPIFDSSEHSVMLTDMASDEIRNKLILDKYKEVGTGRQSVFISHRTEQLENLAKHIPDSEILTSRTKKKDREKIMERLTNNDLKVVLTTYGLFSTGIDISTLEVVYMCTPMRSERWVVQTAGRLKRKAAGKREALVVDFVDKKVDMLRNQYYARRRIWKKIKNQEI